MTSPFPRIFPLHLQKLPMLSLEQIGLSETAYLNMGKCDPVLDLGGNHVYGFGLPLFLCGYLSTCPFVCPAK